MSRDTLSVKGFHFQSTRVGLQVSKDQNLVEEDKRDGLISAFSSCSKTCSQRSNLDYQQFEDGEGYGRI